MARILPSSVKRAIYKIDPLAQAVRRSLNRAVPSGLSEVTVAAGGLKGARFYLDLGSEKDYWLGTYEIELQTAIKKLVEPGDVVYDVGANIGYTTLLLARIVGKTGKVFSFEALPKNIERLEQNVAINDWISGTTIVHGAIASMSAPVRFMQGPSGSMGKVAGSAGRLDGHTEAILIPGIALDDYVYIDDHPAPDVIKMDIEGGEVLALAGMQRLLRDARPLILIELHGPEAARISWEILTSADYGIYRITKGYPPVHALDDLDWKSYLLAKPRSNTKP